MQETFAPLSKGEHQAAIGDNEVAEILKGRLDKSKVERTNNWKRRHGIKLRGRRQVAQEKKEDVHGDTHSDIRYFATSVD